MFIGEDKFADMMISGIRFLSHCSILLTDTNYFHYRYNGKNGIACQKTLKYELNLSANKI